MRRLVILILALSIAACGQPPSAAPAPAPDAVAPPTAKLQVIATDQGEVDRIVGDGTHIYWINRSAHTLMRAERASGLVTVVTDVGLACDLALHGDYVLITLDAKLRRVPKTGGALESLTGYLSSPCAIAPYGDLVYLSERGGVLRIAPGKPPELVMRTGSRVGLAVDADGVYFYDGTLFIVPHDARLPSAQRRGYPLLSSRTMSEVWLTDTHVVGIIIDVDKRGWYVHSVPRGSSSSDNVEFSKDFPIGHGIYDGQDLWLLRRDRKRGVDLVKWRSLDRNEPVVSSPGLTAFFVDGDYVVWVDDGKVITNGK